MLGALVNQSYLKEVNFPFWAKKVRKEIQVQSLWDCALATSHDFQSLIDEYVLAPVPEPAELVEDEPDVAKGKGKSKGKSKGSKGGGKHEATRRGGWLPRMAKLCSEVIDDNWGSAKNLC